MTTDYRCGDTRALTLELAPNSVDLIATSPPFLRLRSYLPDDHPHKAAEIGSEATPAAFLDTLLELVADWGLALAPHGSIAVELGDTYAGSGGPGGDYNQGGMRAGQPRAAGSAKYDRTAGPSGIRNLHGLNQAGGTGWPLPKSLALIPQAFALSLAYARNVLTGADSPAGVWRVRNVIAWHRTNPPVGQLADKFRPSLSYIVVATRNKSRWFDIEAVRGEASANTHARSTAAAPVQARTDKSADRGGQWSSLPELRVTEGAPPLDAWFDEYDGSHDLWTINTQPSPLAHYAMWPGALAARLVLSMCPLFVCRQCGQPSRRLRKNLIGHGGTPATKVNADRVDGGAGSFPTAQWATVGWSDCGHDDWRAGMVLDPFAGSGTTLAAAELNCRSAIGFDIDERNRELYPARFDEVKQALFGVRPELPGQLGLAL